MEGGSIMKKQFMAKIAATAQKTARYNCRRG
jgi:hypothetical protein